MSAGPEVKVIDVVGEGWVMCQMQNVQGDIFYMSVETNEVSLYPPGSPPAPPLPEGCIPRSGPASGMVTNAAPVVRAYSHAQTATSTDEVIGSSLDTRHRLVQRQARVANPTRSAQQPAYPTRCARSAQYVHCTPASAYQYAQPVCRDRRMVSGYEVLNQQVLVDY
jgi:hypothetical protein